MFLFFLLLPSVLAFSCKDQSGNNVDWFAVYKMPIESDNSIPGVNGGVGFYYVDVAKKGALQPSSKDLDSKDQAIAYTLQQFYDKKADTSIFHVMYNDEPYDGANDVDATIAEMIRTNNISFGASVQKGHTKGVAFFDKTSGVWLVHSVPKFPPPDHYAYPVSGHNYGQTMLCMTLKYEELKKIGTQLFFNYPDIYSSNLPSNMAQENPDLAKAIGGKRQSGTPTTSVIDLITAGGSTFKSFAKTNEFNADLYDGLIAQTLKTSLVAETWRRGSEVPLACSEKYHTYDAQDIKVGSTTKFSYTKDHSKMARSQDQTKPFVCIGDINRMTSQFVRGGGSECISSSFLWTAFNVITDINSCPAKEDFFSKYRF